MTCDLDSTAIPGKTFVFGCTGFVGKALLYALRVLYPDTHGSSSKNTGNHYYVNFLNPDISHLNLAQQGYTSAVICSAITSVEQCEKDPDVSSKVNLYGTLEIIRQLINLGIKPVFLSSDYVFDGQTGNYTDTSAVKPINLYGKQKAAVESEIPSLCGNNFLILRLSKLYSIESNSFLQPIINNLLIGKQISAAYDQIFSPTLIDDVIRVLLLLLQDNCSGIFNVCAPDALSRYDIALQIAHACNVSTDLIRRISIDNIREPFRRPHNTSMVCNKLESIVNYPFSSFASATQSTVNHRMQNHV
jgi:dTDP-4-dehydrorhamnose reductase